MYVTAQLAHLALFQVKARNKLPSFIDTPSFGQQDTSKFRR
jgi:hypothetical protein